MTSWRHPVRTHPVRTHDVWNENHARRDLVTAITVSVALVVAMALAVILLAR